MTLRTPVVGVSNRVSDPLPLPGISRALIVDDDPEAGRLLKTRLQNRDFDVEVATSGEEALTGLLSDPPDIIFLDVSMPGMGGLEVLASVREQDLDLAVIMTTAVAAVDVAIEALRLGADDYLRKPFDSATFQQVLDRTV